MIFLWQLLQYSQLFYFYQSRYKVCIEISGGLVFFGDFLEISMDYFFGQGIYQVYMLVV